MTRREIELRARHLIARELPCNPNRIGDGAEFVRDLGADAADMADVHAAVEGEFGIRISAREAAFCETVGTLVDLIETKMENRACAAGLGRALSKNRNAA